MIRNALLILTLASVFLGFSCEEQGAEGPNHIPLNATQFKFLEGSYWVYRNDSTGVEDSVYVDSIADGEEPVGSDLMAYHLMHFSHFPSGDEHREILFLNYYSRARLDTLWSDYLTMYVVNGVLHSSIPHELIANYTVADHSFADVIHTTVDSSSYFPGQTEFYFSDSVGIIKRETLLSSGYRESFSVVRWNVVR
jgi:hypothetical protein